MVNAFCRRHAHRQRARHRVRDLLHRGPPNYDEPLCGHRSASTSVPGCRCSRVISSCSTSVRPFGSRCAESQLPGALPAVPRPTGQLPRAGRRLGLRASCRAPHCPARCPGVPGGTPAPGARTTAARRFAPLRPHLHPAAHLGARPRAQRRVGRGTAPARLAPHPRARSAARTRSLSGRSPVKGYSRRDQPSDQSATAEWVGR